MLVKIRTTQNEKKMFHHDAILNSLLEGLGWQHVRKDRWNTSGKDAWTMHQAAAVARDMEIKLQGDESLDTILKKIQAKANVVNNLNWHKSKAFVHVMPTKKYPFSVFVSDRREDVNRQFISHQLHPVKSLERGLAKKHGALSVKVYWVRSTDTDSFDNSMGFGATDKLRQFLHSDHTLLKGSTICMDEAALYALLSIEKQSFPWHEEDKMRQEQYEDNGTLRRGCTFLCDHCKKLCKCKKCDGCLLAVYCSRECQITAWPSHKNRCVNNRVDATLCPSCRREPRLADSKFCGKCHLKILLSTRNTGNTQQSTHTIEERVAALYSALKPSKSSKSTKSSKSSKSSKPKSPKSPKAPKSPKSTKSTSSNVL